LTQMQAKLSVNKSDITEAVRFWYMHSRLRGDALLQINSWVNIMMATGATSVESLIAQLRVTYEDNESAERAARKLNVIRQNSKPFNAFLAEFDRTILETENLNWSDQAKKTFLSNCISTELQVTLIATLTPTRYRDYCSLLHTMDTNLETVREKKQKDKDRRAITSPAVKTVIAENVIDWELIPRYSDCGSARSTCVVNTAKDH
jgi:hypothetical protein